MIAEPQVGGVVLFSFCSVCSLFINRGGVIDQRQARCMPGRCPCLPHLARGWIVMFGGCLFVRLGPATPSGPASPSHAFTSAFVLP